jgi:hypothetical protein
MNLHSYGHHLVEAYNAAYEADHNTEDFFREVAVPRLFGDEGDSIHVSNSPFFQKKIHSEKEGMERVEAAVSELGDSIEAGDTDGSKFPGGPAKDLKKATASGLSDVDFDLDPADGYAAWLGLACGMTVEGGLTLFDRSACLPLFEGWDRYRRYVREQPNMKWKQLPVWNAYWIVDRPSAGVPPSLDQHSNSTRKIQTCPWALTLLALARLDDRKRTLYIASYGQMNTTIGYVPFDPGPIQRLFDVFGSMVESDRPVWSLLGDLELNLSIYQAAALGQIGLEAFEPADLFSEDPPDRPAYHKSWIMLMLDDESLNEIAEEAASLLSDYESGLERARTRRGNEVDALLEASTKTQFAEAIEDIIDREPKDKYQTLMQKALEVPDDKFKLFTRLIAINYKTNTSD